MTSTRIIVGDCMEVLRSLPEESVHCVVTSPPYFGQRSYGGEDGMLGLEDDIHEHISNIVLVGREIRRVLKPEGTFWMNYGDGYAGSGRGGGAKGSKQRTNKGSLLGPFKPRGFKPKDLMMSGARVAIALHDDGWWLRSETIWHKPNSFPERVFDRPTQALEKVFLFTRSLRYYYDIEATMTPHKEVSLARLKHTVATWAISPMVRRPITG